MAKKKNQNARFYPIHHSFNQLF